MGSPSSQNYAILLAITVLYAGSAYATYNLLQDITILMRSLNGFDNPAFVVDIGTGIAFVPGIGQVVSLIIADGLLVSLHYICLISNSP